MTEIHSEINAPDTQAVTADSSLQITPGNFNSFTYSKKAHLDFFSSNNFDNDFFGQRIDLSNINIKKYQLLLLYSFIVQNINPGANILEISDRKESEILTHFKLRYDCYKTIDVKDLESENAVRNRSVAGEKYGTENSRETLRENYYDLVFCTSEVRNLSEKESTLGNVLNNIDSLIKPGGHALICFENTDTFDNIWVHNLLFTIFNRNNVDIVLKNRYENPKLIKNDPELLYIPKDFTKNSIQISSDRKYSGKGNVFIYSILSNKKPLELPIRSKTRSELSHDKPPVYIFHHLMKCGGSSIVLSLTDWFNLKYDLLERIKDLNIFLRYKYNTEDLFEDYCLTGHFQYDGIHIHQRYPEMLLRNDEFKFFTFIRDPLKVKMSLYYYVKKHGGYENVNLSLKDNLLRESNFLSTLFPCDKMNYKEILDRYFFIGVVEQMQESMDKLAKIIKKKKIKIPVSNTTDKDSQASELTPEFLKIFREQNKLDYLIYDYCVEKFNQY